MRQKYPLTRSQSLPQLSPFVESCVSFSADSRKHSFVPDTNTSRVSALRSTGVSVKIEEAPRHGGCDWKFQVFAYPIRLVNVPAAVLHKDAVLEGTNNWYRSKLPTSNVGNVECKPRYWPFCFSSVQANGYFHCYVLLQVS